MKDPAVEKDQQRHEAKGSFFFLLFFLCLSCWLGRWPSQREIRPGSAGRQRAPSGRVPTCAARTLPSPASASSPPSPPLSSSAPGSAKGRNGRCGHVTTLWTWSTSQRHRGSHVTDRKCRSLRPAASQLFCARRPVSVASGTLALNSRCPNQRQGDRGIITYRTLL